MSLVFDWDPRKARANLRKHSVSFVEAASVFSDPLAQIFADEYHSAGEPREIIIGHSRARRLLLICFTEPERDRVRIISARRATSKELHDYEGNVKS
jgi:uncharacterized DUF497 family protein